MSGFTPARVSLFEAARIVAKRIDLPKGAENPIYAAIDEDALKLWTRDDGNWQARDGEWYRETDVWRPNPLALTWPEENQVSVFDIHVKTADLSELWPDSKQGRRAAEKPPSRNMTAAERQDALAYLRDTPDKTRPEQEAELLRRFPHMTDDQWRDLCKIDGPRKAGRRRADDKSRRE